MIAKSDVLVIIVLLWHAGMAAHVAACSMPVRTYMLPYESISWVQDGMYTLSEMECMGSCVNAPMIAVADYSGPDVRSFSYTYYEDLTPEDAVSIMEDLKAGKKPRVSACCVSLCWCTFTYLCLAQSNCALRESVVLYGLVHHTSPQDMLDAVACVGVLLD